MCSLQFFCTTNGECAWGPFCVGRQLHGILHFDFTSLATLYFYLYHVTHVNCVLSVLLFVFAVLPLVLGDCASLATSLFLECIAEAGLLNWWPELEFNVWCSSFLVHFHFSIPKYFQCVCSCVFSTISSGVFWCVLVYFQWAILVYFQWAFLVYFQYVRSCVFSMISSCVFSMCVQIFVCTFIGNGTLPKQPFHRQRCLSVYLSLSFQRQTRNTSGPTGVLRSKLILFLLIFLSDQKYVWVLWSSSANRQGIDYTFIFSKKNINLLETNSSQRWILC